MKKVGKTTRPFRYDLNQIPHDYTVQVRNRFKGLGLIDYLKRYGQRFVTYNGKGFDLGHTGWPDGFPYFLQFKPEFCNNVLLEAQSAVHLVLLTV